MTAISKNNRFKSGDTCLSSFTKLSISLLILLSIIITRPVLAQPKVYTICFGSYKNMNYAAEAVSRLKKRDYNAFYRHEDIHGKGKWYRAYVEKFDSKIEAKKQANRLINLGLISSFFLSVFVETDQINSYVIDRDIKNFLLHVSSFKKKINAEKEVQRLVTYGHDSLLSKEEIGGTSWFRVYLGTFHDITEARRIGLDLKGKNLISFFKPHKIDRTSGIGVKVAGLRKRDSLKTKNEQTPLVKILIKKIEARKPPPSYSPFTPLIDKVSRTIDTLDNKSQAKIANKKIAEEFRGKTAKEKDGLDIKPLGKEQNEILTINSPVQIKDIKYIKTKTDTETLYIYSNRFFIPEIFPLEGGRPRIVVDIKNAESIKKGLSRINVDGRMIKSVRSHLHRGSKKLRIVLDLAPDKDYYTDQFFFENENIYSLEVKEDDTLKGQ